MPVPGTVVRPPILDWGVSWRALPGERESGDLHFVKTFASGALVGVVDGLGHGPEAAAAARAAVSVLEAHAEEPLIPLVNRCHEALRRTRGVVLSMASISALDNQMTWTAVGNVEAVLFHADRGAQPFREVVSARSGVVGYQLPPLRAAARALVPGDTLAFATDGVDDGFSNKMPLHLSPQEAASEILNRFGKDSDDALVLVVRRLGLSP